MNPGLILMQDGALGYSAKEPQVDLDECGIYPILWPAFSPDLNLPEYHTSHDKPRRVSERGLGSCRE